jgi:hypothetical protein
MRGNGMSDTCVNEAIRHEGIPRPVQVVQKHISTTIAAQDTR